FVLEELRQLTKEQFQELLGGHWRAVRMPERSTDHVLDGQLFAVGKLHLRLGLLLAFAWELPAERARLLRALAGALATDQAWLLRLLHTLARMIATLRTWFRLLRRPIPFVVVEVKICLHEVIDSEVVLPVEEPCPAPDDLLELNHAVDGAHKNDIADVAGIHTGRKLLRSRQNRRYGLVIVLEVPKMLVAQFAVLGGDPLAIVWV